MDQVLYDDSFPNFFFRLYVEPEPSKVGYIYDIKSYIGSAFISSWMQSFVNLSFSEISLNVITVKIR